MSTSSEERKTELLSNLSAIKDQIPAESRESVLLVAVSKLKPASDIQIAYDAGHRHFGENYIQELIGKAEELPQDIQWHFIGGLQSNKCKTLASSVPNLFAVETVDSVKKANELNKGRKSLASSGPLNVFIQVNTSGEEEKSGVQPDEAEELAKHILKECDALTFYGVMTIGALATSQAHGENKDFEKLKEVKSALEAALDVKLKLSMGMSEDFVEAIHQGSDQVRVGSKIFGARPPKKSQEVEQKTVESKS